MAVIVGSSTCHLAQSSEGVFGSGRPAVIPTPLSRGFTRSRPAKRPRARSSTGTAATSPAMSSRGRATRRSSSIRCSMSEPLRFRPAAEGLVVRDDWQGNRSPYKNPRARGAIVGLSLAHGPGHVFERFTRPPPVVPGTSSKTLGHGLQRRADLPRRRRCQVGSLAPDPRGYPQEARPSCARKRSLRLGSAMAASSRRESMPTSTQAARAMVAIEKVVEPDPANAGRLR